MRRFAVVPIIVVIAYWIVPSCVRSYEERKNPGMKFDSHGKDATNWIDPNR